MTLKGHRVVFESEPAPCRGCFFADKDSCPDCDEGIWVEESPYSWHTGTPTEEGWYLVVVKWKDYANKTNRRYKYFEFKNNNWIYNQEFGTVDIIAYWGQKIDPYKEKDK